MKTKIMFETIAGGTGIGLAYLFGGFDELFVTFCVCVVLDFVTGILCAAHEGKVSSGVMSKGLIKKIGFFILIALSVQVDSVFNSELVRIGVIGAFIGVEGLSIVENWGKIGLPLPEQLKNALVKFSGGSKETDNDGKI